MRLILCVRRFRPTATICFEQTVTTKMGVLCLQKFAPSGYYSSYSFRHHHLQYHRPSREDACAEQTHIQQIALTGTVVCRQQNVSELRVCVGNTTSVIPLRKTSWGKFAEECKVHERVIHRFVDSFRHTTSMK